MTRDNNMKLSFIRMEIALAGLLSFMIVLGGKSSAVGALVIDASDPVFQENVQKEISLIRSGKRGIAPQELLDRIESSEATTTIRPITADETTWHPNDRRGTRSHVVPKDTRIRGARRSVPTSATLFLHPARVDPSMSLFKLGTFVYELAMAMDLNMGEYSGDYRIREKRAMFFRNAWFDAMRLPLVGISNRIETTEYQQAKELGLVTEENKTSFPILDFTEHEAEDFPEPEPSPLDPTENLQKIEELPQ